MNTNATPSFQLKEMDTFPLKVDLSIPPERPVMKGFVVADAVVMSKPEVKALGEENLEDAEYFDRIFRAVNGMSDKVGNPLDGAGGLEECKSGKMSMYLLPALVQAYFEQYGEARRKNSRTSPRR